MCCWCWKGCSAVCLCRWCWKGCSAVCHVQLKLKRAVLLYVCAVDVEKAVLPYVMCSWSWKGLSCCMSVQLMLKRAVVCHVQLMLKRAVLLCLCSWCARLLRELACFMKGGCNDISSNDVWRVHSPELTFSWWPTCLVGKVSGDITSRPSPWVDTIPWCSFQSVDRISGVVFGLGRWIFCSC